MITVSVRFFGAREHFTRRLSPEVARALPQVSLPDGAKVHDLLAALNMTQAEDRPLVSINGFYERADVLLTDGDQVQLLRTVVGG